MSKSRSKREPIEKLNQEIQNEAVEFVLQGYRFSEVLEYLQITYNVTHRQAKFYYETAKDEIIKLGDFDLDMVITQHVIYYEEIIRFFDDTQNYSAKAAAMTAKERLLKIFQEDPAIEIDNNIDISIESEQIYNINKLKTEEQKRLEFLFKKVQRVSDFQTT